LGVPLLVTYSLALGVLTACGMVDLHRAGGSRNHFGPSLAGQIEVAQNLRQVPGGGPIAFVSDLPQYREHVHGQYPLRRLLGVAGPAPGEVTSGGGGRQVDIRYRSDDGWDAHLEWHVRNPQDSVNP